MASHRHTEQMNNARIGRTLANTFLKEKVIGAYTDGYRKKIQRARLKPYSNRRLLCLSTMGYIFTFFLKKGVLCLTVCWDYVIIHAQSNERVADILIIRYDV